MTESLVAQWQRIRTGNRKIVGSTCIFSGFPRDNIEQNHISSLVSFIELIFTLSYVVIIIIIIFTDCQSILTTNGQCSPSPWRT